MSQSRSAQLIQELRVANENQDYLRFDAILQDASTIDDPSLIEELSIFFNDNHKYDEILFGIVHVIEKFDLDVYISHLLKIIPDLYRRCPRWSATLLMRILNSETARLKLINQLMTSSSSEIKNSVHNLLDEINQVSPDFLVKTFAVLAAT
jgi:Immunity protein 30